jgi:BMFP domain-containing protein YqiC
MDVVEKGAAQAMARMDLARRSELLALQQRVAALEEAVLGHTTTTTLASPEADSNAVEQE